MDETVRSPQSDTALRRGTPDLECLRTPMAPWRVAFMDGRPPEAREEAAPGATPRPDSLACTPRQTALDVFLFKCDHHLPDGKIDPGHRAPLCGGRGRRALAATTRAESVSS